MALLLDAYSVFTTAKMLDVIDRDVIRHSQHWVRYSEDPEKFVIDLKLLSIDIRAPPVVVPKAWYELLPLR